MFEIFSVISVPAVDAQGNGYPDRAGQEGR